MSNIDERIIFEPTGFEYQNTKAKVVIVGITPGNSDGYDNMRGFDPASEDDMDDNGMSQYMENDDEVGWD